MANSQEVFISDFNEDRQSEMAAENMKGKVKISTTNLQEYKTMYRWKIVLAGKYTSD